MIFPNLSQEHRDKINLLGVGLSQLGAGQAANLQPAKQMIAQRQQQAQQRKMLEDSGIMSRFTEEERAFIASMPPNAAQTVIAQRIFAPKPAPTKGIEVGGNIVNPITGEVIYQGSEGPKPTDDIREYEYARRQGYQGSLQEFMLEQRQAGASNNTLTATLGDQGNLWGRPPSDHVWARDEAGNVVTEAFDAGNGTIVQRPVSVPLRGTGADQTARDIVSEQVNAVDTAKDMISVIDDIGSHDALNDATGMLSWTQAIPGTAAYDFGTRVEQLQGKVFLQAFETLKGGGQITEIEGQKAENAMARIKSGLAPNDFRAALDELKAIVLRAQARAMKSADAPAQQLTDEQLFEVYK